MAAIEEAIACIVTTVGLILDYLPNLEARYGGKTLQPDNRMLCYTEMYCCVALAVHVARWFRNPAK